MKLIILSVVKLSFFDTSFVIFAYNLNTLIIITLLLITLYVIKLTTTLSEGRKFSPQVETILFEVLVAQGFLF